MGRRGADGRIRCPGRYLAVWELRDGLKDSGPSEQLINRAGEFRPRRNGGRCPGNEHKVTTEAQFRKALAHGFADAPLHQIAYHRFPHPLSY